MKNHDIVSAIEHIADTGKVLEELLKLPQEKIDDVLRLLSNPNSVKALERLLQTIKSLQNGDPGRKQLKRKSNSMPGSTRPITAVSHQSRVDEKTLAKNLHIFFSDKSRFRNLIAVKQFVAETFGIRLRETSKEGRGRYIGRLAKELANNPDQLTFARNALAHLESHKKDRAYEQLYSFIRGRLK